jgi:hypothetical protein
VASYASWEQWFEAEADRAALAKVLLASAWDDLRLFTVSAKVWDSFEDAVTIRGWT